MAPVSLGCTVLIVEDNPRHATTPGADAHVLRPAIVQVVHPDPNPEGKVDLCVFGPDGPRVETDVPYDDTDETTTVTKTTTVGDPPPPTVTTVTGKPGTWRWPPKVEEKPIEEPPVADAPVEDKKPNGKSKAGA